MWYELNKIVGVLLLIAIVGGAARYALTRPPLLRQRSDDVAGSENQYQRQARKNLQRRMSNLQDQHSEAMQQAIDVGRRATGS
jgi:hypothetical protein